MFHLYIHFCVKQDIRQNKMRLNKSNNDLIAINHGEKKLRFGISSLIRKTRRSNINGGKISQMLSMLTIGLSYFSFDQPTFDESRKSSKLVVHFIS